MNRWLFAVPITFLAFAPIICDADERYQDDPAIVNQLRDLAPFSSHVLPKVKVDCGDVTHYGIERFGPGQRDYCNKMPYAADRGTALYAGGNHQVPHRMNDVWEYHLGSNTWHLLYGPDGGNPGKHKSAYFLTSRTLVRDPDKKLSVKEEEQIAAYRDWWDENIVLRDGHLTTKPGGPIMPAHTWDAFCYDSSAKNCSGEWGPARQLKSQRTLTSPASPPIPLTHNSTRHTVRCGWSIRFIVNGFTIARRKTEQLYVEWVPR